MAYKCYEIYTVASVNDLLDWIITCLKDLGWEEVKKVSATNYCLRSNGEDADEPYGYINIYVSSTNIHFIAGLGWDSGTNAIISQSYSPSSYRYITYTRDHWIISGNKNLVAIYRYAQINYTYNMIFGHIPKRFYKYPNTVTTSAISSTGNGIQVTVAEPSGFIINTNYWMYDINGAVNRDQVKVVGISGNTLTLDGVGYTAASGAPIGALPSVFGGTSDYISTTSRNGHYLALDYSAQGTGAGSSSIYGTVTSFTSAGNLDPDARLSTYVLQPVQWLQGAYIIGYSDEFFLYAPLTTNNDIYGVTADGAPLDIGIASEGSDTTLTCAGKTWGESQFVNKIVVIVDGVGAGQTRKIISHTDTVLTVSKWKVNPALNSVFYIVDEAYRQNSCLDIAFKEIL